ncbi:hypothetical protein BCAR13_10096 [Paraburkholderia caribensis]|nr:hypothetical protein BCAR13_10096 [Paraburkholderia caribensis]
MRQAWAPSLSPGGMGYDNRGRIGKAGLPESGRGETGDALSPDRLARGQANACKIVQYFRQDFP